jgi:hypothetical protein
MDKSKLYEVETSRPRLDPGLKERIESLADRLKINNMPLSSINNILCSIGLEALERSFDIVVEDLKKSDIAKKFFIDPSK